MEFALGGSAAAVAGFFTNPLELIKTRIQLQGELERRGKYVVHYKNVLHAGYIIAKHDGLLALQKGLVPSQIFQFVFNGWRLGSYQLLQQKGYITDKHGNIIFHKNLIVSGLCGASGIYFASPLILIKTHLQSEASKEIAFGHQHKHEGTWSAFKTIFAKEGVKGLYRGSSAAALCAFVGSTSQLMSFSYVKKYMKDENILRNNPVGAAVIASMVGGIVLCLAMTPFDLILTRLYNQGIDASGRNMLYKNFPDCVMKIWRSEGFLGFYKGIGPSYIKLGPQTVLCLVFWDKFQNIYANFQVKEYQV